MRLCSALLCRRSLLRSGLAGTAHNIKGRQHTALHRIFCPFLSQYHNKSAACSAYHIPGYIPHCLSRKVRVSVCPASEGSTLCWCVRQSSLSMKRSCLQVSHSDNLVIHSSSLETSYASSDEDNNSIGGLSVRSYKLA